MPANGTSHDVAKRFFEIVHMGAGFLVGNKTLHQNPAELLSGGGATLSQCGSNTVVCSRPPWTSILIPRNTNCFGFSEVFLYSMPWS